MEAKPALGAAQLEQIMAAHARPCVATIGTFDGVHAGHRALVAYARAVADAEGLPLTALTFSPRPEHLLSPATALPDLCSLPERVARLRAAGADDVLVVPFTRETAAVEAKAFGRLLRERLGMRVLVVGEDFALGRGRAGTVTRLREWGHAVITVPPVLERDRAEKISSSRLRRDRAEAPAT